MPSWCLGEDGGLPGRSQAALAARAKSKARIASAKETDDQAKVVTSDQTVANEVQAQR